MKRGFTLIEVLVVIVILGILATIAIPKFKEASKRNKEHKQEQVIRAENTPAPESHRIQVVGWHNLHLERNYSPRVIILLDTISKIEFMVVQCNEHVAVTPIPKSSIPAENPTPQPPQPPQPWKSVQ